MANAVGDVVINGNPYLLITGGYSFSIEAASRTRSGRKAVEGFDHADGWNFWGQSDFMGMGIEDWYNDGPFYDCYGLDLSVPGRVKIAPKLNKEVTDTLNTSGYVGFGITKVRAIYHGKDNGVLQWTADATGLLGGTQWQAPKTQAQVFGAGNPNARATSSGPLKNKVFVGTTTGKLFSTDTTDGVTYLDEGAAGPTTPSYVLGSFKGLLWVGFKDQVFTYTGSVGTYAPAFAGQIEGTPIAGAVGDGLLYFITNGPDARVYATDGVGVHQIATLESDFQPETLMFHETLFAFGEMRSNMANTTKGQVWRKEAGGFRPIFEFGDGTKDHGIRSALIDGANLYWGANHYSGIGVYDPRLDIFKDTQAGFYVGSVTTAASGDQGIVDGLVYSQNSLYCSIRGKGIFHQTTPGTFRIKSAMYDDDSKNIMKLWGRSEIHHTTLAAGQSINIRACKAGSQVEDLWGTNNTGTTGGVTGWIQNAPTNYKTPFIQYVVDGDAAGSALELYDIGFAFLETPENPKKRWTLKVDIAGSTREPLDGRDGKTKFTRNWQTMITELNALANMTTSFEDLDGSTYTVILQPPIGHGSGHNPRSGEIFKSVVAGVIDEARFVYTVELQQL